MRALWAEERSGWPGSALGRIAAALAARDAAAVRAAAPDSRSGSQGVPRSSNCQETPTCRQVKATMEARLASLHTRLNAGGLSMSQQAELNAEMYKVLLAHVPACLATETQPHCVAESQNVIEEARRGYRSALETARHVVGRVAEPAVSVVVRSGRREADS